MAQQTIAPYGGQMSQVFGRAVAKDVKGFIRNLVMYGSRDAKQMEDATHTFMFRPAPINENGSVQYTKTAALGMSHSYHVYNSTDNNVWSFEVYQNVLMAMRERGASANKSSAADLVAGGGKASDRQESFERGYREGKRSQFKQIAAEMELSRRFIDALRYPPELPGGTSESPPLCILCLPGLVTATCRLVNRTASYEDFGIDGTLKAWRATLTFEEAPQGRITMDSVLARGSFRG